MCGQTGPSKNILAFCKYVFAADDAAKVDGKCVLDTAFIEHHTSGLDEFEAKVCNTSWDKIEVASGLTRQTIEGAAQVYFDAERVIGICGMALPSTFMAFRT
jgi:anaerobic selenocysteine-containing dehydrogenase